MPKKKHNYKPLIVVLVVILVINVLFWLPPAMTALVQHDRKMGIPVKARSAAVKKLYPSCLRDFEPDALNAKKNPVIRSYGIDTSRNVIDVTMPGDLYYHLFVNDDKNLWLTVKIHGGDVSGSATDPLQCDVDGNDVSPKLTKLMLQRYGRCQYEKGDMSTPYTYGSPVCVTRNGYVSVNQNLDEQP